MKTFYSLVFALIAVFPMTCVASSSSLSFEVISPGSTTTPMRVAVVLRSEVKLNAIEGMIKLPLGVLFAGIDDTSMAVSYWLTEPAYASSTRQIPFAGILLGGKDGTVTLFEFLVRPPTQQGELLFTKARAFTNSPDGTEAPLTLSSLMLHSATSPPWALSEWYILAIVSVFVVMIIFARRVRLRWI